MDRISVLLFGVTTNADRLQWSQILHNIKVIKKQHDNLYIRLVLFNQEPTNKRYREETLSLVDEYMFAKGEVFQDDMRKLISGTVGKTYEPSVPIESRKILLLSCCYRLRRFDFWNKLLLLCCDDKRNLDMNNAARINHRFMYGRTDFIFRIWSGRPFIPNKDVDQNIFINVKNIIGNEKIPKYTFETQDLQISRSGWGVE